MDKVLILWSVSTTPVTSGIHAVPSPGISWTSYHSSWFLPRGNPGSQLLGRNMLIELLKCFFLPACRRPRIRGRMDRGRLGPTEPRPAIAVLDFGEVLHLFWA